MQASEPESKCSKLEDNSSRSEEGTGAPGGANNDLPRRFGRLTLLRQIARGGMGEVFLAASGGIEGAERPCVVKIIRREHAEDPSFLARFLDEARIQAQLQHPGVAQILEAATDAQGKPYVLMEFIEGRNLGDLRLRANQLGARIAWPDAVAVAIAVVEALSHVHERTDVQGQPMQIVHRDLSPQNVMVGYQGEVKLIDFGTARGANRRCQTVAGIVFAKPGYVAPEVASNLPGGPQADLYAVGIMLWELLAGRRFLSGDAQEHLSAVAKGERRPTPVARLVEAPEELDGIIARLTTPELPLRYETARAALGDLVQLLKEAPSLADGERSVSGRIAQLVRRLYPAEPARTRADFARLVALARKVEPKPELLPSSPEVPPSEARDPSLLPGTRYRLVREIGRGGMGVVHEAVHCDLGRSVAIKVLSKGTLGGKLFDRFRNEARAIASLRDRNLVELFDFGVSADGQPFYVMELLEGESLDCYLERERGMDWREAVRIGVQACSALGAAHCAGVIHRDIKPGNLFVCRDGTLKLLDFGVAKAQNSRAETSDCEKSGIFGTPEYMAPEQAGGGDADERSDLYSLGCVLYELLTGALPFAEESTLALLAAKTEKTMEPVCKRAPKRGIPSMLDQTIQRATATDPSQRFKNAAEMRAALEAALQEPLRARQRRRSVSAVCAALAVVGLGGIAWYGAGNPAGRSLASARIESLARTLGEIGAGSAAVPAVNAAMPALTKAAQATVTQSTRREGAEAHIEAAEGAPAPSDPATDASPRVARAQGETGAAVPESEGGEPPEAVPSEDEDEGTPPDQEPSLAAAPEEPQSPAVDALASKIQQARDLMDNGQQLKGFNALRRLGRNNRQDPRVLQAWSEAAVRMKGWGEAYRVALQWAEIDQSPEARLHLARMERALGKRDHAVRTLKRLLVAHPECEGARTLLQSLTPRSAVAMQ